jgi:hypothetical protein
MSESPFLRFLSLTSIGSFLTALAICSITCSVNAIPSQAPSNEIYFPNNF